MIKHIFVTLIVVLSFIFNADADMYQFARDDVDNIITISFDTKDKRYAVNKFLDECAKKNASAAKSNTSSNVVYLFLDDIQGMCKAGGLDIINNKDDEYKCTKILERLLHITARDYAICGKKSNVKSDRTEHCIDKFFESTDVSPAVGIMLAKEYARIKNTDTDKIECSQVGDNIRCISQYNAYEFVFGDLSESFDNTIISDMYDAVCKIHDATDGCKVEYATTCDKIKESLEKFGYSAKYEDEKCKLVYDTIKEPSGLRTAFGIDNFYFCRGDTIQPRNTQSLETYLKEYVAKQATNFYKEQNIIIRPNEVECDAGVRPYKGEGCNTKQATFDSGDDIKTCYVIVQDENGDETKKPIDFVFDDINEYADTISSGGIQAVSCIIKDGKYSGRKCFYLNQEQCQELRSSNQDDCPECKAAYWDNEIRACVLPSSADATYMMTKGRTIKTNLTFFGVGVAIVGVTYVTAGIGLVPALVIVGVDGAGTAMATYNELELLGVTDEFLTESNQCQNATCAEELVKQWCKRLANISSRMTSAEYELVDTELARLMGLLPENSELIKTYQLKMEDIIKANKGDFFDSDSWEEEEIYSIIGNFISLCSGVIAGGILAALKSAKAATKFPKFLNTLKNVLRVQHTTQASKVSKALSDSHYVIDELKVLLGRATKHLDDVRQLNKADDIARAEEFIAKINNEIDAAQNGHKTIRAAKKSFQKGETIIEFKANKHVKETEKALEQSTNALKGLEKEFADILIKSSDDFITKAGSARQAAEEATTDAQEMINKATELGNKINLLSSNDQALANANKTEIITKLNEAISKTEDTRNFAIKASQTANSAKDAEITMEDSIRYSRQAVDNVQNAEKSAKEVQDLVDESKNLYNSLKTTIEDAEKAIKQAKSKITIIKNIDNFVEPVNAKAVDDFEKLGENAELIIKKSDKLVNTLRNELKNAPNTEISQRVEEIATEIVQKKANLFEKIGDVTNANIDDAVDILKQTETKINAAKTLDEITNVSNEINNAKTTINTAKQNISTGKQYIKDIEGLYDELTTISTELSEASIKYDPHVISFQ